MAFTLAPKPKSTINFEVTGKEIKCFCTLCKYEMAFPDTGSRHELFIQFQIQHKRLKKCKGKNNTR